MYIPLGGPEGRKVGHTKRGFFFVGGKRKTYIGAVMESLLLCIEILGNNVQCPRPTSVATLTSSGRGEKYQKKREDILWKDMKAKKTSQK